MSTLLEKYRPYLKNKDFLRSFTFAALLFCLSLIVNFYANIYATEQASNAVTDFVLSNTRVFDVDGIFVYGPIILWVFVGLLGLLEPKRFPFGLKCIALFVLIRSLFISLTHIGPYPFHVVASPDANIISRYALSGADLFFSAHTGLPFLMALVFWKHKYLRFLFIASAIFFGIVVLLAHLHYSIDVLAAFFITFTIYRIAEAVFWRDKKVFDEGLT